MRKVLRVVPPSRESDGAVLANGTHVYMPDGAPVPGITKIEMVAEAGGVWMARLHCRVVLDGELVVEVMPPEPIPESMMRIEGKLDVLLSALVDELAGHDEAPALTLDGEPAGFSRPEGEPL